MSEGVNIRNSALLIVDMLEDYFDASMWPESVLPEMRTSLVENQNH